MAGVLLFAGLVLSALPWALRRVGRRLPSPEWAQLCLVGLIAGTVLVELGAVLWAAPTVLRGLGLTALADACARALGPLAPLGPLGGGFAAVLATALPVLGVAGWVRSGRRTTPLFIEGCLGEHLPADGYELVVLPTPEALAYSVVDPSPQVVISQGLLATLDAEQLRAVLDHERAHLTHRHPQHLRRAAAAAQALSWWPPASKTHRALRAALERWADDVAAGSDRSGQRALRTALLALVDPQLGPSVAGFSLAEATAERVQAMQEQPRASSLAHIAVYLPGLGVAIAASIALGSWVQQVHHLVLLAGQCTI